MTLRPDKPKWRWSHHYGFWYRWVVFGDAAMFQSYKPSTNEWMWM